jgi:hypothetical protein
LSGRISTTCAADGRTTWKASENETGRWMLSVDDVARYPVEMTRAVVTLFKEIS